MKNQRIVPGVVAMAALAGLAAASASAGVRVIHASPDAPSVDVYVNGTPGVDAPAITNLPFRSATGYVPLPTGDYNFKVTPVGLSAQVVIDANAAINGATDYSVVAINFLSSISPLVLVDDNTIDPVQARVRFVHASPDVPTVDITTAGGGSVLFNAVSFGNSGGYISVPGGTYDLDVRLDSNNALALPVPGVTLDAGKVYTIFAMGALSSQNVQAVVLTDAVPTPGAGTLLAMAGLLTLRRRR
ncbi:MAG: DUF4397 domain-containing protein [Phycisphaerales bacterium]